MATKPWRSGFCGLDLPPDSHGRCKGGYEGHDAWRACCCDCHLVIETPAGIAPGVYEGMSNDAYHAEPDYLSSSKLKALLPEHYKAGGSQDALDFGTLFHTIVLEPDQLGVYVALDAEKVGVKADGTPAQSPTMTAAWKKAVADVEADGKIVVAKADWDRAHAMAAALHAHPEAAALLDQDDARHELSVFVEDESGIRHKARFDLLAVNAGDLKSTSAKPGRDALTRAVIDYGYDLSAAHYLEVARIAGIDVGPFSLIFVGKTEPYRVTVCDLDDAFLARGRALRDLAVQRFLEVAPAYEGADTRLTLTPPPWARRLIPDTDTDAGIPADFTWSLDDYS